MEITRHFTATAIVVYDGKALLHLHKKLGMWLPVGGHIDRDELPEEAAVREAKEESGLEITLYRSDKIIDLKDARQLMRPEYVLLEDINQYHQHIDFVYFATAATDKLQSAEGETNDLKWLTKDEIEQLDMRNNVKVLCLEALETIK